MDIFAHGLWTGAVYAGVNTKKREPKLNVLWATFWGVIPDIFAFAPVFTILILGALGVNVGLDISNFRPTDFEPAGTNPIPLFNFTSGLYNISHSIVIFLSAFLLVCIIFRRPVWEMGGWLIHILIDIPTHSYAFFPTPFLWPLFNAKVNGISWAEPWFMVLNYGALIIVYFFLWKRRQREKQAGQG